MDKLEQVARKMWEQRRRWSLAKFNIALEEWGDGSIPQANGVIEEARVAIREMQE